MSDYAQNFAATRLLSPPFRGDTFAIRLLALLGTVATAGCGLVDSDIADFSLTLPEKDVTVDSAQWDLADVDTVPAIDCGDAEGACDAAVGRFCTNEEAGVCFATCEPAPKNTCKATFVFDLWNTIELDKEAPELESIDGAPIGRVSIKRIFYKVTDNTFNVDSPPLTVAVAPQGVLSAGDPQAFDVGTIAPVPAGELVTSMDVELTDDGIENMQRFLKEYTTPFNLIVRGVVELSAGDPVPTGRLTAVVQVEAIVGL